MPLDYSKSDGIELNMHLFKPTKSYFNTLSKKFIANNNVTLNNFGISDSETISKMFYNKKQSGLASLYKRNLDNYNLQLNQCEEISLKRIDEYIRSNDIQHIYFIKIDIEGHELKAFAAFGNYLNGDFINYIQFEYGGANLDSHSSLMEIYKFFEDRNFSLPKIMPKGLVIRKYKPYMDIFMYANYVAISNKVFK